MFGLGSKGPLCACPAKFTPNLIPPIPALALPEFPQLNQLLALTPAMGAPAGAMSFIPNLGLLANLTLPGLPIPPLTLGSIAAIPPAMTLVTGALGIDLMKPGASAALALSLKGLLALPLPPIPAIPLPLLKLNTILTTIQAVHANLGINLLKPNILPRLQLAINAIAALPPLPFNPAPVVAMGTLLRACAGLGINLTTPGAFLKLQASLNVIAQLALPALPNLNPLLALLALLQIFQNIQNVLGLNLQAPRLNLQIQAALLPLEQLEGLQISANAMSAAATWSQWPLLGLALNANLPLIAKLDFSPLAGLPKLPDLGPLAAVASFVSAAGLGLKPSCPSCPMKI